MSRGLRYQKPEMCEYLAGQYVAGSVTPLVQARIETLRQTTPELDRAISKIADEFADIHLHLQAQPLSSKNQNRLWENLEAAIEPTTTSPSQTKKHHAHFGDVWQNIVAWQLTTGLGMALSVTLAFVIWQQAAVPTDSPPQTNNVANNSAALTPTSAPSLIAKTQTGPSYLATMSAHNDNTQTTQFVISAYPKVVDTPSRLHVQWSERISDKTTLATLHLWAEDIDTGALTYIGPPPPKTQPWHLTKTAWQAVSNSSRLLMTSNKETPTEQTLVFSGVCLQLKPWGEPEAS